MQRVVWRLPSLPIDRSKRIQEAQVCSRHVFDLKLNTHVFIKVSLLSTGKKHLASRFNHWYTSIVHKQLRIRTLSWPDVSYWTCDQGHNREHHFCFYIDLLLSIGRDVQLHTSIYEITLISTSQTFHSWIVILNHRNLWRFCISANTERPGLLLVWMFYSEGHLCGEAEDIGEKGRDLTQFYDKTPIPTTNSN